MIFVVVFLFHTCNVLLVNNHQKSKKKNILGLDASRALLWLLSDRDATVVVVAVVAVELDLLSIAVEVGEVDVDRY